MLPNLQKKTPPAREAFGKAAVVMGFDGSHSSSIGTSSEAAIRRHDSLRLQTINQIGGAR
jgi:hypothetical protein